jgi:hypothetical protein
LRPVTRRWNPSDLDTARRVVSRAERRALDQADQFRRQAEDLLRSMAAQAIDAEKKVREAFAAELRALRDEMETTSRRVTIAESELELYRGRYAELRSAAESAGVAIPPADALPTAQHGEGEQHGERRQPQGEGEQARGGGAQADEVPPVQMLPDEVHPVDPELEAQRVLAAARSSAARLHSQAELELARAKEEAVRVLSHVTQQAADLLAATVAAVERDTAIAAASREQATHDGVAASAKWREADAELARVAEESRRIRVESARSLESAHAESARTLESAHAESARTLDAARAESDHTLEAARSEAARTLEAARSEADEADRLREQARAEADAILEQARRQAETEREQIHRHLGAEIVGLRDAMDRTRESFETFLQSVQGANRPDDSR